jgi:hypothetical protein
MPDISMCKGKECPLKKECYRFRAKPDYLQAYFMEVPYKDGKCDYFESLEGWAVIRDYEEALKADS